MYTKAERRKNGKLAAQKSIPIIEAQKKARILDYNKNPSICFTCNKALVYEKKRNKFCSSSCSATHNNKIRIRRQYNITERICGACDKLLMVYQGKFCSIKCTNESSKNKTKLKIESGQKVGVDTLRKFLFKTRSNKCEICNGSEWFGKPMPLIMDHINGNPSDDSLTNLRLICPNCDRFLPTFGSRNKGSGRAARGMYRKY